MEHLAVAYGVGVVVFALFGVQAIRKIADEMGNEDARDLVMLLVPTILFWPLCVAVFVAASIITGAMEAADSLARRRRGE